MFDSPPSHTLFPPPLQQNFGNQTIFSVYVDSNYKKTEEHLILRLAYFQSYFSNGKKSLIVQSFKKLSANVFFFPTPFLADWGFLQENK